MPVAPTLAYKAGKQHGFQQAALKFTTGFLVLAICWCSAGLMALDFARILPSSLSPWLDFVKRPVHIILLSALLFAGPIIHLVGTILVPHYKVYAPLKGGARFIYLQAGGWCLYSAGLLYVASDLIQVLYPPARFVCLQCEPGFLIALAAMLVVGNSLLIASLYAHEHTDSKQVERIKRSHLLDKNKGTNGNDGDGGDGGNDSSSIDWGLVVDVQIILVGVIGVFVLGLKNHPSLTNFGKHKDAVFATDDGAVELPFCETPYQFSSHLSWPLNQVAQLPSAILHMPYVPVLNLILYFGFPSYQGIKRGTEQLQILLALFVFQVWTGVGHIHPNPRKLFIQETSIMLSLVVLRAFVNSMTTNPKYQIGTAPFLKLLVFFLSCYICFGLMPTIGITSSLMLVCLFLGINGQEICRPDSDVAPGRAAQKNLKELVKQLMPDLTVTGKMTLSFLLFFSVGTLQLEVQLCSYLMAYNDTVSWHAPFDLFFWQGFWAFVQVIALSKPGSMWRRDPEKEQLAAAAAKKEEECMFPLATKIE